jgi:hypothetical protein
LREESLFCECVWFEEPVCEGPHLILLVLIMAIQGPKVEVGGVLYLGAVSLIRVEEVYYLIRVDINA